MGEDGLGWPGWDDAAVLEGAIPPNFTEKKVQVVLVSTRSGRIQKWKINLKSTFCALSSLSLAIFSLTLCLLVIKISNTMTQQPELTKEQSYLIKHKLIFMNANIFQ